MIHFAMVLVCTTNEHRHHLGDIVLVGQDIGQVLTEGFDVHGRHVGWIGVPGRYVRFQKLCHVQHASTEQVDAYWDAAAKAPKIEIVV